MVNSDQLDILEMMISKKQISHENAVKMISSFAKTHVDFNLDEK